MGELPDGHAAQGARVTDDEDPDSNGRSSFFSRLFRRDSSEDDDDDEPASARNPGAREFRVNIRKLSKMRVEDVSIPRADIIAISEDAGLADVVEAFKSSELTRLPVYSDTLDQPLGLVHLKDFALGYGFGPPASDFDLKTLLRPLLYAPPSMPIGVLLQKMQAQRIHMALVIDEYGGVDGLVTIEDLIEQIVGDISDEHDEAESALFAKESAGIYLVEGRMDLEAFEAAAGVTLASPALADEVDTLGGLVFRLAGRVPVRGEIVTDAAGHEFEVVEVDARKIQRLRVRLDAGAASKAAE